MRVFTVNVGINTNRRYFGRSAPIYSNGSFDFIPIPTSDEDEPTYRDLGFEGSFNRMDTFDRLDEHTHNDPEFVTNTFGTFPETSPNVHELKRVKKRDFLVFVASLQREEHKRMQESFLDWIAEFRGMYFIGMLEVLGILHRNNYSKKRKRDLRKYSRNSHFDWFEIEPENKSWIFRGSKRSMLFPVAVPIGKDDVHSLYNMTPKESKKTETAYVNFQTKNGREILNIDYLDRMISKYNPIGSIFV